ncbi:MAG TPA: hypothetical protein VM052_06610 [Candidatus Limnocylindrales bacterium]|nr:hypothetical protein [Candidatus Limnocylindrales bacterium]
MADETVITFAKDDTIIVEAAVATVATQLEAGGWVRFERNTEVVHVQASQVRYIRAVKMSGGGR